MFRKRLEFYQDREFFLGQNKAIVSKLLNPDKFQEQIDQETLPQNLTELLDNTINKTSFRTPVIFGLGTYQSAHLIQEGEYDINLDLSHQGSDDEIEIKTKKTKIRVQQPNEKNTILFTINPSNTKEKRALEQITRDENGELKTAELKDLEERAKHPSMYTSFSADFDPEELDLISTLWNAYTLGEKNINLVQNYFLQMGSLILTGSFADVGNSKILTGVKGLKDDKTPQIISCINKLSKYGEWNKSIIPPSEEEQEKFREVLIQETPWYKNEKFQRNINLPKIISITNNLGSAYRKEEEGDSAVNIVAIATENLTSEIYESLLGKDCNNEDFVKKLKYINKTIQDKGILDPFLEVYTSKKISPANIRGDMIHVGTYRSGEDAAYNWAVEFYKDLSKTLLSSVAKQGTQYFEFDRLARLNNLVNGNEKSVAYVPLAGRKK